MTDARREPVSEEQLREIERWIPTGKPNVSDGPLLDVIASHRALADRLAEVARERDEAERALRSKGYRKECDIPACNCGRQWNHGGHAESRLREIDEALPYENGKTILQRVEGVVRQLNDARATMAKQAAELQAIRDTVGDTDFALRQQVARLREALQGCVIYIQQAEDDGQVNSLITLPDSATLANAKQALREMGASL